MEEGGRVGGWGELPQVFPGDQEREQPNFQKSFPIFAEKGRLSNVAVSTQLQHS